MENRIAGNKELTQVQLMNKAIQALYLEVPNSVANDVSQKWVDAREYLLRESQPIPVKLDLDIKKWIYDEAVKYAENLETEIRRISKTEIAQTPIIIDFRSGAIAMYQHLSQQQPIPINQDETEELMKDPFIQKHLARIWELTKDSKIELYIKPMFGGLEAASIRYFLETGTVNGDFYLALHKIMDSIKNWQSSPSPIPVQEGLRETLVNFFVWFRNNGEANIGKSVEGLVDEYLKKEK